MQNEVFNHYQKSVECSCSIFYPMTTVTGKLILLYSCYFVSKMVRCTVWNICTAIWQHGTTILIWPLYTGCRSSWM